jgi:hypothetical protein
LLLGGVVHLLILWYYNSSKTDRGDLLEWEKLQIPSNS